MKYIYKEKQRIVAFLLVVSILMTGFIAPSLTVKANQEVESVNIGNVEKTDTDNNTSDTEEEPITENIHNQQESGLENHVNESSVNEDNTEEEQEDEKNKEKVDVLNNSKKENKNQNNSLVLNKKSESETIKKTDTSLKNEDIEVITQNQIKAVVERIDIRPDNLITIVNGRYAYNTSRTIDKDNDVITKYLYNLANANHDINNMLMEIYKNTKDIDEIYWLFPETFVADKGINSKIRISNHLDVRGAKPEGSSIVYQGLIYMNDSGNTIKYRDWMNVISNSKKDGKVWFLHNADNMIIDYENKKLYNTTPILFSSAIDYLNNNESYRKNKTIYSKYYSDEKGFTEKEQINNNHYYSTAGNIDYGEWQSPKNNQYVYKDSVISMNHIINDKVVYHDLEASIKLPFSEDDLSASEINDLENNRVQVLKLISNGKKVKLNHKGKLIGNTLYITITEPISNASMLLFDIAYPRGTDDMIVKPSQNARQYMVNSKYMSLDDISYTAKSQGPSKKTLKVKSNQIKYDNSSEYVWYNSLRYDMYAKSFSMTKMNGAPYIPHRNNVSYAGFNDRVINVFDDLNLQDYDKASLVEDMSFAQLYESFTFTRYHSGWSDDNIKLTFAPFNGILDGKDVTKDMVDTIYSIRPVYEAHSYGQLTSIKNSSNSINAILHDDDIHVYIGKSIDTKSTTDNIVNSKPIKKFNILYDKLDDIAPNASGISIKAHFDGSEPEDITIYNQNKEDIALTNSNEHYIDDEFFASNKLKTDISQAIKEYSKRVYDWQETIRDDIVANFLNNDDMDVMNSGLTVPLSIEQKAEKMSDDFYAKLEELITKEHNNNVEHLLSEDAIIYDKNNVPLNNIYEINREYDEKANTINITLTKKTEGSNNEIEHISAEISNTIENSFVKTQNGNIETLKSGDIVKIINNVLIDYKNNANKYKELDLSSDNLGLDILEIYYNVTFDDNKYFIEIRDELVTIDNKETFITNDKFYIIPEKEITILTLKGVESSEEVEVVKSPSDIGIKGLVPQHNNKSLDKSVGFVIRDDDLTHKNLTIDNINVESVQLIEYNIKNELINKTDISLKNEKTSIDLKDLSKDTTKIEVLVDLNTLEEDNLNITATLTTKEDGNKIGDKSLNYKVEYEYTTTKPLNITFNNFFNGKSQVKATNYQINLGILDKDTNEMQKVFNRDFKALPNDYVYDKENDSYSFNVEINDIDIQLKDLKENESIVIDSIAIYNNQHNILIDNDVLQDKDEDNNLKLKDKHDISEDASFNLVHYSTEHDINVEKVWASKTKDNVWLQFSSLETQPLIYVDILNNNSEIQKIVLPNTKVDIDAIAVTDNIHETVDNIFEASKALPAPERAYIEDVLDKIDENSIVETLGINDSVSNYKVSVSKELIDTGDTLTPIVKVINSDYQKDIEFINKLEKIYRHKETGALASLSKYKKLSTENKNMYEVVDLTTKDIEDIKFELINSNDDWVAEPFKIERVDDEDDYFVFNIVFKDAPLTYNENVIIKQTSLPEDYVRYYNPIKVNVNENSDVGATELKDNTLINKAKISLLPKTGTMTMLYISNLILISYVFYNRKKDTKKY